MAQQVYESVLASQQPNKKQKEKPILFSLGGRGAEEWPDHDSSDEDYVPEDPARADVPPPNNPDVPHVKITIRRNKQKRSWVVESDDDCIRNNANNVNDQNNAHKQKKVRKKSSGSGNVIDSQNILERPCAVNHIWGIKIPPVILLKVFSYVVDAGGPLPFLVRASRVCKLWKEIAYSPMLWRKLDMSFGWIQSEDRTLVTLCIDRVSKLKEINLNGWKHLTNCGLQALADYAPELESIGVSNCTRVSYEGLKYLMDNSPQIKSLDISYLSPKTTTTACLQYILDKCCERLTHFNISGNTLVGFQATIKQIIERCPNLESLEISKCQFSVESVSLDVETFQQQCPKLRVLNIVNSRFRVKHAPARIQALAPGFPNLEELKAAVEPASQSSLGMDNDFLHRLLKCSHGLKLLDLRGNTRVTVQGIQQLPITDLTNLLLGQSSIAKHDGIEIIVQKWEHSLEVLDLAWNSYPDYSLDVAMEKLASHPDSSKLRILNLSGTCITCVRLKSLLEGCPYLSTLNLASCRSLPRGMKRAYTGNDMDDLRRNIDYYSRELT